MTPWTALVVFGALASVVHCGDLSFPPGFKWGAATASYQVEGAWNVSDKTAHIWDTFSHTPGKVLNGDTGDVACDSYRLWRRDIQMAKELGLDFYRLSLSWSRLLPNGFATNVSEDGKRYYNDLIDGLLEAGIEPVVTLYHWDLPQNLQDLGGWANPLIADWFGDYARVVYTLYGDRVKLWLTINEPLSFCATGYGAGFLAPGIRDPNVGYYLCTKHALLGHAKAYRVWDNEFRPKYNGGWANPLIADWFEDYARVVYTLYGDRVKMWLTINEPLSFCAESYADGLFAPGIRDPNVGYYLCTKHALLGHAKAYRVWDKEFRPKYNGGWANPLIAAWFEDYARVAYTLFGDRVKTWLTINEPLISCSLGYGSGMFAPGLRDPNVAYYLCSKNMLLAHARAYRVWDRDFRPKYNGKVSLANHYMWYEPFAPEEEELTRLVFDYAFGRYSHPIFSREGGWPPALESKMAEISRAQGYPFNKLPPFTEEEKRLVQGTADFLGFNHYTSRQIRSLKPGEQAQDWAFLGLPELNVAFEYDPQWAQTSSFWFKENPAGIRKALKYFKDQYGDVEILITENGFSSRGSGLNDDRRINYYKTYLEQVLLAIKEDGVKVTGYTAWSLMDNFEWAEGYQSKFGLYEVDFSSPNRTRTPRKSAKYYASVVKAHSLDVPYPGDVAK